MPRMKCGNSRVYVDIDLAMYLYNTGHYTLRHLGYLFGISPVTVYKALRDAGCKFSNKWRKEESVESSIRRSNAKKGQKLSEKQKRLISERNSCDYNGLNGYGHTKSHNRGYVVVYVPKHPHAHKDGYVMLHTVIMERNIGRYLEDDEVVHHINHNRKDNRINNLQLMKKKEHMSMHMKERYRKGADHN